jgi:hypothetical protein
MGSGAVIYVPSFMKIGSGVQTIMGGDTQTHPNKHMTATWYKPTLFFKIRKVGQKSVQRYYPVFEKVAILFLEAHFKSPYFLELEYS